MNNLLLDVSGIHIGRRLTCDALQFFAGQQIHLLGPNGSGKSTLLAALADGKILFAVLAGWRLGCRA